MLLKQMVKVRSKQYYCIVVEDRKVRVQVCFSGTNQKPERRRPFGTGLVRHCPQGLFSPFFTFLRAIFFRPFRLSLVPTICPWVSEDEDLPKCTLLGGGAPLSLPFSLPTPVPTLTPPPLSSPVSVLTWDFSPLSG